jgi:hypothetical protein
MIRVEVRVEACQLESGFGEELIGGEVVGDGGGGDSAKLTLSRGGDKLEEQGGADALAAEIVIDAEIEEAQDAFGGIDSGDGEGGEIAIVLEGNTEAIFDARKNLLEGKAEVIGKGVVVEQPGAKRARREGPCEGGGIAGALEVEVLGGFDGGVDLKDAVEVGGDSGADLHRVQILMDWLGWGNSEFPAVNNEGRCAARLKVILKVVEIRGFRCERKGGWLHLEG